MPILWGRCLAHTTAGKPGRETPLGSRPRAVGEAAGSPSFYQEYLRVTTNSYLRETAQVIIIALGLDF